jgi:hypothetical protein
LAIVVLIYLPEYLIERPAIEVGLVMQPFGEVLEDLSIDVVEVTYTVRCRLGSVKEIGSIVIEKFWREGEEVSGVVGDDRDLQCVLAGFDGDPILCQ